MSRRKFPKQMQIKSFFVSSGDHKLNEAKQFLVDSERQEKEEKDKTKADADKKAAKDEEKRKQDEEKRLTKERIHRKRKVFIDDNNTNRDVNDVDVNVSSVKRKKRWSQRPPNWKYLTEHYQNY